MHSSGQPAISVPQDVVLNGNTKGGWDLQIWMTDLTVGRSLLPVRLDVET